MAASASPRRKADVYFVRREVFSELGASKLLTWPHGPSLPLATIQVDAKCFMIRYSHRGYFWLQYRTNVQTNEHGDPAILYCFNSGSCKCQWAATHCFPCKKNHPPKLYLVSNQIHRRCTYGHRIRF